MPAIIILLVLLYGTPLNLAFAEGPGEKSFDIQKPTPEHEASLRKAFMAQVSRDLASRKEHVISRHMFLTDFIAEVEQKIKANTSTKSTDAYSRIINSAQHEQRLLVQQYRLLTQLEELADDLRKKELTKVEYLHQKALINEALMRTSQSILFQEMVEDMVESLNAGLGDMAKTLNAGLNDIKSELSHIQIQQIIPMRP